MPRSILLSTLLLSLVALPAAAESVVVMGLRSNKVPKSTLTVLDSLLAFAVQKNLRHEVVTTKDIEAQLGVERLKDTLGCDDVRCAADISGALGARFLMAGSIDRLGDDLLISLSLIDTQTQKTLRSQHKMLDREKNYDTGIDAAVIGLTNTRAGAVTTAAIKGEEISPEERAKLAEQEKTLQKVLGDLIKQHPNSPKVPEAWFRLAEICERQGKLDKALFAYKKTQSFPAFERAGEVLMRIADIEARR